MPRKRPGLFYVSDSTKHPNGESGWRVSGFRKQYWFKTRKLAQIDCDDRNAEIIAHGSQVVLSAMDRIRAVNAAERLAPFGKNIDDAVNFYVAHLTQLESSIPVSEFCKIIRAEFDLRLSDKNASLRHRNTMFEALRKLEARFGPEEVKTISGIRIKEWLSKEPWAIKTRVKILGYIRNAWNIGIEKGVISAPLVVKNFPRNKKSEAPPFPLSPEEAVRLLSSAEPSVLPFIAIGMFAGLRSAERNELNWKDIHLDGPEPYIDLSAKIAKTGRRRLVPVQPSLRDFLAPFAKSDGLIIPLTCNGLPAYQNAWERSVKAAGLWPWSENRLRDSFVSYRYESTGSAEITAKEAGHSVQVMFDRYQKIVTKEAAERFWAIRPVISY
jgi:integrase